MKNKCLDNFYKSLAEELQNPEYVKSIKELIEIKGLNKDKLTELITKKAK